MGGRLTWLVACGGACWTWLLASWGGVSPMTSLWRAVTVFMMLAAVMTVAQVILLTLQERAKQEGNRSVLQEASDADLTSQEREAA
ncbi:MAG: hypothetical protein RMK92_08340 [Armatimonadota bacterium]|nr:hypothetical protein [Armatimonadota bacterium]